MGSKTSQRAPILASPKALVGGYKIVLSPKKYFFRRTPIGREEKRLYFLTRFHKNCHFRRQLTETKLHSPNLTPPKITFFGSNRGR